MTSHISEYKEAQERFKKLTIKEMSDNTTGDPVEDYHYFDEIIEKLCRKDKILDIGQDSTMLYELLLYSDFIQIKNEIIEPFYSELCSTFILSNLIEDIVRNLKKLEDIQHVKSYLVRGLFRILQLTPIVENSSLVLTYSKEKLWYKGNLQNVLNITILPSAYKLMLSNTEFNMVHLNFLLRMFNVKRLILSGCNLNGRNTENLLQGLELEYLNLSECGTSVNEIIQNNVPGTLNNLKELDLSKNPLFNETLERIRWIPLNYLNLAKCIKTSGKFINSIWFEEYFASQFKTEEGQEAQGNIDLLWEDGILKETIKILNVSFNDLSKSNLQTILQSQLKELDITDSLSSNSVDFSEVMFPETLKVLRAQKNKFFYGHFKVLCGTRLEKLEMDYYEKYADDFSHLSNSCLTKTLDELSLCVLNPSEQFISFISNIKLKFFNCSGKFIDSVSGTLMSAFISNYNIERKYLRALQIEGPNFEIPSESEFFSKFRKLNLVELSLLTVPFGVEIVSFLSCENLHESIESLKLGEHYSVSDKDLLQIVKFKKLVKLSFTYTGGISDEILKKTVEIETLENLKATAIINGPLDVKLARLLCIAPVELLRLYRGGDVSDEAFQYLMRAENAVSFCENLVSIISVSSHFTANMARIFEKVNWAEILLIECTWPDNSSDIILSNKNLVSTLKNLSTSIYVNKCWNPKYLSKMNLSKLKTGNSKLNDTIQGLHAIPISDFLFSLSLSKFKRQEDIEYLKKLLQTNLSVIDEYRWSNFRCE